MSTSLFPLFYVTREFFRFLQQGDRGGTNEKKQGKKFSASKTRRQLSSNNLMQSNLTSLSCARNISALSFSNFLFCDSIKLARSSAIV